jgi:hypothetical protein
MAAGGKQSILDQADRRPRKEPTLPALPKAATAPSPRHPLPRPVTPPVTQSAPRSASPPPQTSRPDQRASVERRHDRAEVPPANGFSRQETLAWITEARKKALVVRVDTAKAAEARIVELEASLEAALERVTYLGSENQSLQTSLDMAADENFDLGRRLAESEMRNEVALSELQNTITLQAEHDATLRTECDMALAAAEQEIETLRNTITERNARIQKMEQARRKVERDASKQLEAANARDTALADAEQRIRVLTALFEKLESSIEAGKASGKPDLRIPAPVINTLRKHIAQPRPDERKASLEAALQVQIQKKPQPRLNAQAKTQAKNEAQNDVQPQVRLWRRELDTDDWLLGRVATQ